MRILVVIAKRGAIYSSFNQPNVFFTLMKKTGVLEEILQYISFENTKNNLLFWLASSFYSYSQKSQIIPKEIIKLIFISFQSQINDLRNSIMEIENYKEEKEIEGVLENIINQKIIDLDTSELSIFYIISNECLIYIIYLFY